MSDTTPRLPAPGAQRLRDFEPLLPAEGLVLRAAASGGIAKVGYRRPRSPTAEVRVRAEFLAFLARGGDADAPVVGRRLQILGACVIGRLDLIDTRVSMSLWFYRCAFAATPRFDCARVVGSLSFADCALPGLRAEGARIEGDLALSAGCDVDGEIRLTRSHVGRDLNCERLHMRGTAAASLTLRRLFVADAVRIDGDVNLQGGVETVGEMRFVGARIGGELRAGGARMTADIDSELGRGVALNLDRARVGGNVALDAGFTAAGTVRLQHARIRGDLDCSGAAFDAIGDACWGAQGSALRLDHARIDGALILRQLASPLQAASLADARLGTLADDAGTWGQHHVLDGFTCRRFGIDAPTDAPTRLAWLTRQDATHLDLDYRPEPWRRVIRVLRRMGHGPAADTLSIGRERHLRRIGRIGRSAPTGFGWLARIAHDAWGVFAGYGHRPARLLVAGAIVWALCGAAYWAAAEHGGFTAAASWASRDARQAACPPRCAALPAGVPEFKPFVYSLDVLLPGIDIRQERHWVPARGGLAPVIEAVTGIPLLQWLIGLQAVCGWALAAAWLGGLFGLGDRDRRLSSA